MSTRVCCVDVICMHGYVIIKSQNTLQRHRPLESWIYNCNNFFKDDYYIVVFELSSCQVASTMAARPLLFACVLSSLSGLAVASQPQNLTFMMVASFGQYGFNSSGALPAVDMALEDINSDPDILSGYNLMYDKVRDSMVSLQIIISYIYRSAWCSEALYVRNNNNN